MTLFSLLKHGHLYFLLVFLSVLYFLSVFALVVQGSAFIVSKLRNTVANNAFIKLGLSILSAVVYTGALVFLSSLLWQTIFLKQIDFAPIYTACAGCAFVITFFSIVYEVLFLTKEKELDKKVVKHLDNELMHAKVNILKNELDPHFVYNSLMPLYYLIKNDVPKAELFAYKLMQVYQHFLQKRQNDFITLEEELEFIHNYIYLLQIRFKDSLELDFNIQPATLKLQIIPFSLQLLVENAIKHNRFDREAPLKISVESTANFVIVSNTFRAYPHEVQTSKIGLNNLRTRYKILSDRTISVLKNKDLFVVKIPLLRNASTYDVNRYNRG